MPTITKAISVIFDKDKNPHSSCHISFFVIPKGNTLAFLDEPLIALIDSGATNSYLGQTVIDTIGLKAIENISQKEVGTPGGGVNATYYEDLTIEIENGFGRIAIPIKGIGRSPRLEGYKHSLVIGMDVIQLGLFSINGPEMEFSFSIPDELIIPVEATDKP